MDQSDVGFVMPGVRHTPDGPDFNTVYATNMRLCHAFLRRHLWKGIYTSYTNYCNSPTSDTTWPVSNLDESDTDSSGIVFHGTNVKID